MMNNLTHWSQGFFWGFVAFPVAYYIVKNLGYIIYQDAKQVWLNVWHKAPAQVQAVV